MGCGQNSGRCFLLTICSLQIATTALRQVFDFLGFMWLPIIANFFNFIFVIFGFFGAYQYKPKYILTYVVWVVAWVSWNAFVTCFYLNVGLLDNTQDWLNFGTGSASWWQVNGPGCRAVYPANLTDVDPYRPLRPERVDGCLLDYVYVETVHATVQCVLAMVGASVSLYLLAVLSEEEDTCKAKMRATSIYSVEYSPNTEDSGDSIDLDDNGTMTTSHYNTNNSSSTFLGPGPSAGGSGVGGGGPQTSTMTPRRVKRHNRNRSSGRARQPSHPTPETNFANNYTCAGSGAAAGGSGMGGSVGSINGIVGGAGAVAGAPSISGNVSHRSAGRSSQRRSGRQSGGRSNRRPHYVNPVTQLMDDSSTSTDSQKIVGLSGGIGLGVAGRLGHSNPMYVHSRPGSLHSLAATTVSSSNEPPLERPPSVHSSYSNYHGVRASLNQAAASTNALNPIAGGNLANLPHGGLQFGRGSQPGKGLRGSQNSILSSSEQRRTALTSSEIRVPASNGNGNSNINSNSGLHSSVDSNLQALSNATHAPTATSAATIASQYNNSNSSNNSALPQTTITSVTNISPSSIIGSSHNTSSNTPFHLQHHTQQQQQLITHQMVAQQQLQLQKQQQQQQLQQQQQQQQQHHNQYHQQHQQDSDSNPYYYHHQQQQPQQPPGSSRFQPPIASLSSQYSDQLNSSITSNSSTQHYSQHPQQLVAHQPYSPQYTTIAEPMGASSPRPRESIVDDLDERPPPYALGAPHNHI